MCYEVIFECITFLDHSPSLNQENVQQIISDTVYLRNKLIYKINHPELNDTYPRNSKALYRGVIKDLYDQTIVLTDRLNSLPR